MTVLNFKGLSVEVELWNENQKFTSPVVKLVNVNDDYWTNAYQEDGSVVLVHFVKEEDKFKMLNFLLKYKGHEVHVRVFENEFPESEVQSVEFEEERDPSAHFADGSIVHFQFFSYEDSIPFRDNFPLEKYQAAVAAKEKVEAALAIYHKEMKELGAKQCVYHGFDTDLYWLAIEDIPDYKWDYKWDY